MGLVDIDLELLHLANGILLVLPNSLLTVELLLRSGNLTAQLLQALFRQLVFFFDQRLLLDLHANELALG